MTQLDPLDRALARWRREPPPPVDPALRARLLATFDARFSARPRRRAPALQYAAAAAIVFAAIGLSRIGGVDPAAHEPAPAPAPAAEIAALDARLDRLLAEVRGRLAVAEEPEPTRGAIPAVAAAATGEERFLAWAEYDPALRRLWSARAFEPLDAGEAARRYEELLRCYPNGPAANVARDRLRSLDR